MTFDRGRMASALREQKVRSVAARCSEDLRCSLNLDRARSHGGGEHAVHVGSGIPFVVTSQGPNLPLSAKVLPARNWLVWRCRGRHPGMGGSPRPRAIRSIASGSKATAGHCALQKATRLSEPADRTSPADAPARRGRSPIAGSRFMNRSPKLTAGKSGRKIFADTLEIEFRLF